MAIVAIGRNGIGLGHISRLSALCNGFSRNGLRPFLFASDGALAIDNRAFPVSLIHRIDDGHSYDLEDLECRVNATALLSHPAVVIEDTHPLDLSLDPRIQRYLVVRPLLFPALLDLERFGQFDEFFLADDPNSPTWPYDERETAQIKNWPRWHVVGPVHRSATKAEVLEIRKRYAWSPRRRICVFSLGGGGEHSGSDDASSFFRRAQVIGDQIRRIDPAAQLILIKGPLMQAEPALPEPFRVVSTEPLLPALFAAADLACIRPGFNCTWECISGGTPIFPIAGTSYNEPIAARLKRLDQFGFLAHDIESAWKVDAKRAAVRRRAQVDAWGRTVNAIAKIQERLFSAAGTACASGSPQMTSNGDLQCGHIDSQAACQSHGGESATHAVPFPVTSVAGATRIPNGCHTQETLAPSSGKSCFLRIDDVSDFDRGLQWVLATSLKYATPISLEVIPYLCTFDANALSSLGLTPAEVQIGQHGFCHVPRVFDESDKSEFSLQSAVPADSELTALSLGKRMMEQRFDRYFGRGYSAPFDGMPLWLGQAWEELGGSYVSIMRNRPPTGRLPILTASVDAWDWNANSRRSDRAILTDVIASIAKVGYAGIVLHQQHFAIERECNWLDAFLGGIKNAGFDWVAAPELARFQAAEAISASNRAYATLPKQPARLMPARSFVDSR